MRITVHGTADGGPPPPPHRNPDTFDRALVAACLADTVMASRATSYPVSPSDYFAFVRATARDSLSFPEPEASNLPSLVAWYRTASDAVEAAIAAGTVNPPR